MRLTGSAPCAHSLRITGSWVLAALLLLNKVPAKNCVGAAPGNILSMNQAPHRRYVCVAGTGMA